MRTFNYNSRELDFLGKLLYCDLKNEELRRRAGKDRIVWSKISKDLNDEFELNERELGYCVDCAANMYEEDSELVNQSTRFDIRGLPFD